MVVKAGVYGRWRAPAAIRRSTNGSSATSSPATPVVDDTNYTENGAPLLFRIESGPVRDFPQQLRSRARTSISISASARRSAPTA
jgi:hypothetical protein